MDQALVLRRSLPGLWGLASSSGLHSLGGGLSTGRLVPHVRAAGGELVREPCPGGARLHPRRQERHARIPSDVLEACRVPSPVTGPVSLPTSYMSVLEPPGFPGVETDPLA